MITFIDARRFVAHFSACYKKMLAITACKSRIPKLKFLVKVVHSVRENLLVNMTFQCLKMSFIQLSKRHLRLPFSNIDKLYQFK